MMAETGKGSGEFSLGDVWLLPALVLVVLGVVLVAEPAALLGVLATAGVLLLMVASFFLKK